MVNRELKSGAGKMPAIIEPLAVSPQDASTMLGVCLATIYNRMASGELPSTQLGRRRLIPIAAIHKIIDSAT